MSRNKDYIEQRAIESAHYIIENQSTIRETAQRIGVSKSTTHKDLIERLPEINYSLYKEVIKILDKNKETKHIRGGIATKEKYEKLRRANEYDYLDKEVVRLEREIRASEDENRELRYRRD